MKKLNKEKEMNKRITNVVSALDKEYKESLDIVSKYASPSVQRKILNTKIDAVKLEKRLAREYDIRAAYPRYGFGAISGFVNNGVKLDYARDITNTRKGTRYNKWLTKG